jgi:F-type H+-transporting ATPase subunit b
MRLITSLYLAAEEGPHRDDNGQIVTHHWLLPERSELIYGTIASILIFGLLWKFAGPAMKTAFTARTARIQSELDASAEALAQAEAEAADIRQARGDIDAERQRLFADADTQAQALLDDGRARLEAEVAELEARAQAELASAGSRAGDELRGEITRIASDASDRVIGAGLDEATHQQLIESFIQRVGAST